MAFLLLSLFVSCVGTIKDKNSQSSNSSQVDSDGGLSSYRGFKSATAVAHDKIELVFEPAVGDPASLVYEIFTNFSSIPLKLSASVLENSKTINGDYLYTVTGLAINTEYSFNVKVVKTDDQTTTGSLDPSLSLSAKTFKNTTANFLGLTKLSLGDGPLVTNTIVVHWIPASISGTDLNIKENDPVAYVVTYWANGYAKTVTQYPSSIETPILNRTNSVTLNNLQPNTTYYVNVRAIHKGYAQNYKTDPLYQYEKNNKTLSIRTKETVPLALNFINDDILSVINPIEERGMEEVDLSWGAAYGNEGQYFYRIAYKEIDINLMEHLKDQMRNYEDIKDDSEFTFITLTPDDLSKTLTDLNPRQYYQAKVFTCTSALGPTGEESCPIGTKFKSFQVKPPTAPFDGIVSITHPNDINNKEHVKLNFNAPTTSLGFLSRIKIYCHDPSNYSNKIALSTDGSTSSSSIVSCNNIKFAGTSYPQTLNDYKNFVQLPLHLGRIADSTMTHCFSMKAVVEYADSYVDESSYDVVKCITPALLPPTASEFPGRDDNCNISGTSMTITWPVPSGGIYSHFLIYTKKKSSPSDYFNFNEAVSGTNIAYTRTVVDKSVFSKQFTSLVEGASYFVGVLAGIQNGATYIPSAFNAKSSECQLPAPQTSFNEWVDLIALGPKEDALATGQSPTGASTFLYEKFDNDGAPIEVTSGTDSATTKLTIGTNNTSNVLARGVANPYYRNSNQGMIKLAWKDITFTDGKSLYEKIGAVLPAGELLKTTNRQYGYKVYRSSDNRQSWVDLTPGNAIYPDTTATVSPATAVYKSGASSYTRKYDRLVHFTDYSVQNAGSTEDVDNARIYWYKVIPFFAGKELTYNAPSNPEHHHIRVTLPPKNMALVHRWIANRVICLEMQKNISKKAGAHYSCNYNGIGASGLSFPWIKGNTVYDLGGDLLIDRFELGCAFTRGASTGASTSSILTTAELRTANMDNFVGCLNINNKSLNSYSTGYTPDANKAHKILPGDCVGQDYRIRGFNSNSGQTCNDSMAPVFSQVNYPGSQRDGSNVNYLLTCAQTPNLGPFESFPYFPSKFFNTPTSPTSDFYPTQSEFGAVYHNRLGWAENWAYGRSLIYKGPLTPEEQDPEPANPGDPEPPAAVVKTLSFGLNADATDHGTKRGSSCQINLAYKDSNGDYIPRWIPISNLVSSFYAKTYDASDAGLSSTPLVLYDKTLDQVRNDVHLYDSSNFVAPPNRLNPASSHLKKNFPIARIATSNSAKLPPIDGASQGDLQAICGTYKVNVGVIKEGGGSFVSFSGVKQKRLIRKKEFTVAAAWPEKFEEGDPVAASPAAGTISWYEKNSCNTSTKTRNNYPYGGVAIKTALPVVGNVYIPYTVGLTNDMGSDRPADIMTGSSAEDKAGLASVDNTEKCVSRFGVQDLIGNMNETASDEIFCDYRPESAATMWIGDYIGILSTSGIDKDRSVPYNPAFEWYDATAGADTKPILNGVRVMVEENADQKSGSCSAVSDRVASKSYLSGNTIIPIKKQDGSWDLSILERTKVYDQESVDTLRSGDGSFLLFGKDKIVKALDVKDKIKDTTLFNPAIGLPVSCDGAANCDVNNDNQFSKNYVMLGRSQITNNGMSEITTSQMPIDPGTGKISQSVSERFINRALLDQYAPTPGSLPDMADEPNWPITNTTPNDYDITYLKNSDWSMWRSGDGLIGASARFYVGGNSSAISGRYSTYVDGRIESEERYTQYRNGGRCGILINEN